MKKSAPVPTITQAMRLAEFWTLKRDVPIVGAPNRTDAVLVRHKWIACTSQFGRSAYYGVTPHGLLALGMFLSTGGATK